MLCTDLTLPVMIVLSGMALTLGFPAKSEHENFLVPVEIGDSQLPKENRSCHWCKSLSTRHKNRTRRYVEPILIKLENVYGKYEEKHDEIEKHYFLCNFLKLPTRSNTTRPNPFGCLNFRKAERKIVKLRKEMGKIAKNLQYLIYFEKSSSPKKRNGHQGRLKLLEEFLLEIQNLLVELKHKKKPKKKKKKRNKSLSRRMPEKAASANLSPVKSQIKLQLEECILLQNLNTILKQEIRNLKNFSKCL